MLLAALMDGIELNVSSILQTPLIGLSILLWSLSRVRTATLFAALFGKFFRLYDGELQHNLHCKVHLDVVDNICPIH